MLLGPGSAGKVVESAAVSSGGGVGCRLCGSPTRSLGQGVDVALFRCLDCRFVSGVPQNLPPPESYYSGYHAAPAPPAPIARYEEWLQHAELLVGCGRLLEIGAGRGGFVRAALGRSWSTHATELSQAGLHALRELGTTVFEGDVLEARYPDGHFDLVVSIEVLEHVPKPLEHLREMRRITRPGGLLLLTTPNFGGLSRRMFGLKWRAVAGEHLGYFEPRTLAAALGRAGYAVADVRSRTLDVSTWRAGRPSATFDEQASARVRDAVEGRATLRLAKGLVNRLLGLTGLGDSLLVWARCPAGEAVRESSAQHRSVKAP